MIGWLLCWALVLVAGLAFGMGGHLLKNVLKWGE